jgi:anti-sigma factor RsiW
MDQDNFDHQLIAYLFDELDEHERAEVKRRLEAHPEARVLELRLRATVERTRISLEEPSADLETRILTAAARAERGEPWHRKLLRVLAWAGSHAMRPQFAMGALMVMLLGSSLLLLRAKPGAMRVSSETGGATAPLAQKPEGEDRSVGAGGPFGGAPAGAAPAAPAPSGLPTVADTRGRAAEVDPSSAKGANDGPEGDLARAQAVRATSGCKDALPLFAAIRERFGSSGFGADATFEEARCHRELDDRKRAKELAATLRDHPEYRRRIAEIDRGAAVGSTGGTAAGAAAPRAPAKASSAAAPPKRD